MKLKAFIEHPLAKPALGAALAIIAGIALWMLPFGERWRFASYDSLFRFATRPVTNHLAIATNGVAVVFMDNDSYAGTGQFRSNAWDRARHAKFLDRLAEDGCPLVVFDVFFGSSGETNATLVLVESMKRLSNVVLMARQTNVFYPPNARRPGIYSVEPMLPLKIFRDDVRKNNWGVGTVSTNRDGVVRQHWRFPSPGFYYDSLAWKSAKVAGAHLSERPQERWVRYYEPGYAWTSLSYMEAEMQTNNYFRDKVVFIGNKPKDALPNGDKDEFSTPFTNSRGGAVAGVEILATEFLNLVNHEWLQRPAWWIEFLVLLITGALLGYGLCCRRKVLACLLAIGAAFIVLVAGVCLSHFTKYWFPWLIVAGGQVPLALVFALAWRDHSAPARASTIMIPFPAAEQITEYALDIPDYELIQPPFGKGAYGKVWLARNAVGQWQAVKAIYRARFGEDASPYEREFRGLVRYQRVSHNHPGLLRIDFVSRMKPEGYFYYAMELGDAVTPGWEQNPTTYKPLDLAALCAANNGRLPPRECARIGAKLCDALQFLHSQGLAHRDIKPRNTIFVNGQPKLADVGLVADAQRPAEEMTWVGTPGFMPPDTEPPGTPQADIYSLGIMLYVISTGGKATSFPELSTTIVDHNRHPEFDALSRVIFKACHPDRAARYASVIEMHAALLKVEADLVRGSETG